MYRISAKYNEEGIRRQTGGAIFLSYGGCRQTMEECEEWISRHKELLENWSIYSQSETLVSSSVMEKSQ